MFLSYLFYTQLRIINLCVRLSSFIELFYQKENAEIISNNESKTINFMPLYRRIETFCQFSAFLIVVF